MSMTGTPRTRDAENGDTVTTGATRDDPTTNTVLFIHGAAGYLDDRPLAAAISEALGAELVMPRLPDDDMSVPSWTSSIRPHVDDLSPADMIVAHSFGASMLVTLLRAMSTPPRHATLLAMPNWGPDGWNIAEYDVVGAEPTTSLTMHHCRDDDVVPYSHLTLNSRVLPSAQAHLHDSGGHQCIGLAGVIAAGVRGQHRAGESE